MRKLVFVTWLAALAACVPDPGADLPNAKEIKTVLGQILADTGGFAEVTVTRTIGMHYLPGQDKWQVIACFSFVDRTGNRAEECNDAFFLYRLANRRWVATVDRNGVYRWRELDLFPKEQLEIGEQTAPND